MTWILRVSSRDELLIEFGPAPVTGVARLDFDEGSFAEFDAHNPLVLVAVCVMNTPAGRRVLDALLHPDISAAFAGGRLPRHSQLDDPPPLSPAVARWGRVAQLLHFARFAQPRTRPFWHLEALAAYVQANVHEQLPLLPTGVDLALLDAVPDAVAASALDSDLRARLADLAVAVLEAGVLDDRVMERVRTTVVVLRAGGPGDVATTISAMDSFALSHTLTGSRGSFAKRGGSSVDLPLGGKDRRPELRIDRGNLPRWLELGWAARVTIESHDTEQVVTISAVAECRGDLQVRAFVPPSEEGRQGVLLDVAPVSLDATARTLTARLRLVEDDFAHGPILLELVDEFSGFDPLPLAWEYWALAAQSDLIALRLLAEDESNRGLGGLAAARRSLDSALQQLRPAEREAFRAGRPALGFVSARLAAR